MNYLTLENVSKTYGEKVLFENISLQINQGQKVALVAKNGSGKSTLLRVIAGQEPPEGENSSVYLHRGVKLKFLNQDPDFYEEHTVLEAVFDSDNPMIQAIKRYERTLLFQTEAAEAQAAIAQMDDLKAWDFEAHIQEILTKFEIHRMDQMIKTMSGGQKKRLALAKLIIDKPEMVILDEPTNHLDLDMIEWLEEYLGQPNLTVFMVTHDRYFLERVCNEIVELDRGKMYRYSGNYSAFLEKKANRHENEAIELEKDKKLLKKELDWVNRSPQARSTKAKSRVDSYYGLKDKVGSVRTEGEMQIDIKGQRLGKKILEAHNISKKFGEFKIIEGFSYKFQKEERVGIVGPNGVGKSTFLHLLTEQLRPDSGKVVVGDNTVFGFYTQDGIQLSEDKRVIDVIQDIAEYIPLDKGQKLTAPQLLERFMFDRKQQQVYVSQLSGGEKRRLYLLSVLMKNPNFLILDEPTNDLDIMTLNVLEDFLLDFPGCIIIVSHDRYFLDKLVDHLFIFEGEGHIKDFLGDYSDYRVIQRERERQQKKEERSQQQKQKEASQAQTTQTGLTYEQRKEMNKLEKEISKLEEQKQQLEAKFLDAATLTTERITSLAKELDEVKVKIEDREMKWLEYAERE